MNTKQANWAPYTPGPWTCAKPTRLKQNCISSESGPVAITSSSSEVSRDTNLANARLIAAAPELHDLARAARDYLSGIPETAAGGDDAAVKLTRDLDAILARIGGAA